VIVGGKVVWHGWEWDWGRLGCWWHDGNQPDISHLLEDVVDVIEYGIKLSCGVAELLDVGLKVIKSLVVA